MARKKKDIKTKEPVRIRYKELSNGNKSVYLDIYTNGKREYKFLKLYIVPEKGKGNELMAAKIANENTMQIVNAIKAQMILSIAQGKAGICNNEKLAKSIMLVDWIREYKEQGYNKTWGDVIEFAIKKIDDYKSGTTLAQVDKQWLVGFNGYLDRYRKADGEPIKMNTKKNIYSALSGALNLAVRREIININPITRLSADEKPKRVQGTRAYLTKDEVKALECAECKSEEIKSAFMFACFCGLRVSDIRQLKWGDLYKDGDNIRIAIEMQKTKREVSMILSKKAVSWLPERGTKKDEDCIYNLPTKCYVNRLLKKWAAAAGVRKQLSFHVSRHTFATMSLTAGVDIYTTSKLLGHSDVKVTQVYAKIVDSKKDEAITKIDNFYE